jgi:hypothetical protein
LDVREGFQNPFLGVIEEGRSSVQPEETSAALKVRQNSPESPPPQWCQTKVCRCQFRKTGVSFVPGITGADGDMLFQQCPRFRAAFPLEGGHFPAPFHGPVNGSRTDPQQLVSDGCGEVEGGPGRHS